jgi:tRNA threonylcarbamoyladenosine biosynthesis protein TsaB
MILAIDTATRSAGLAILDPDLEMVLAEHMWRSQINHTVELAPNLAALLATQVTTTADLTGIVVVRGPGSFTGLRIGMSLAKALAYAHDIDLVTVSTLDVIAHGQQHRNVPLWAILEAGRGRIVAARYPLDGPRPTQDDYRITTIPELARAIADAGGPVLLSGELKRRDTDQLMATLGDQAVVASPANRLRRPAHLAEMGWLKLQTGRGEDPTTVAPVYLQP